MQYFTRGLHLCSTVIWYQIICLPSLAPRILPQRLRSAFPLRRTTHGDLLTVAGGDVTDVWQLLEVLPGLV